MTRTIFSIALAFMLAPGAALAQPGQQGAPAQQPQFNTPGKAQGINERTNAGKGQKMQQQQRQPQRRGSRPTQRQGQRGGATQNTKRFNAIDANDDGRISLQEYKARAEGRDENIERVFQRLDVNGDGKITRREARQYARQRQNRRGSGSNAGQR